MLNIMFGGFHLSTFDMFVLCICAEYLFVLTARVVLQIMTTVTVHHPGGNLRSRDRNVCIYSYLGAAFFPSPFYYLCLILHAMCFIYGFIFLGQKIK